MTPQFKARFFSVIILIAALFAGFFSGQFFMNKMPAVPSFFKKQFVLGLDLKGGARLLYKAETGNLKGEPADAMSALRDTIERRVNIYGVSEPLVQVEQKGGEYRLAVELAGVKDVDEAIKMLGETPFLEFRELNGPMPKNEEEAKDIKFVPTGLDGRLLSRAAMIFDQNTGRPQISVEFNEEGVNLFAELTGRNVGKPLGIFLDGIMLSQPIVNETITGGKAQISGRFTVSEARELSRYLNSGALPVPIVLIARENVEASLGDEYVERSLIAGLYGFMAVAIFMVFWYRFPGIIAAVALMVYAALTLALFKLIPVTLTTAGITGFILSVGMAVDANILIFERMKEELRRGRSLTDAVHEGFQRAWTSIRDSNMSSLITSAILYYFGTSVVKGFALTLALGVLVSMFTALTATRNFLLSAVSPRLEKWRWIFMSGIGIKDDLN